MLNRIKNELLNIGLKFIDVDEKIVRMILETSSSHVNEIVILPAVKMVMKKILGKLQNKKTYGRVYNGQLNNVKVSVIRSLVGCPSIANVIECFLRSNVKIIIRVYFCGGLVNDNIKMIAGDILIPKLAHCGDGTSPQYIMKYFKELKHLSAIESPIIEVHNIRVGNQMIFSANPDSELKNVLLNVGKAYMPGKVKECEFWTTDALFCETEVFINALKSIDVGGVDMESSILFLLGKLFNLKTASILSVSDLPGHPIYDMFKTNAIHPDIENGIDNAIKILIKALPKIKTNLL